MKADIPKNPAILVNLQGFQIHAPFFFVLLIPQDNRVGEAIGKSPFFSFNPQKAYSGELTGEK